MDSKYIVQCVVQCILYRILYSESVHFAPVMLIRIRSDPDSFGSVDPESGYGSRGIKSLKKCREKQSSTNKIIFFSQEIIFLKSEPKKKYVQSDLQIKFVFLLSKIKRCFENLVILLTWIRPGSGSGYNQSGTTSLLCTVNTCNCQADIIYSLVT